MSASIEASCVSDVLIRGGRLVRGRMCAEKSIETDGETVSRGDGGPLLGAEPRGVPEPERGETGTTLRANWSAGREICREPRLMLMMPASVAASALLTAVVPDSRAGPEPWRRSDPGGGTGELLLTAWLAKARSRSSWLLADAETPRGDGVDVTAAATKAGAGDADRAGDAARASSSDWGRRPVGQPVVVCRSR